MVYFIISKTDNLVKIGYSKNPQRRLKELTFEHKKPLEIYNVIEGDISIEKYFHNKHKDYHVKGEWFDTDLLILNDYDVCYDDYLLQNIRQPSNLQKKEQIHYSVKPSFKELMLRQANKEDKNLNEFMYEIHYNYLKRKKAL